ILTLMLAGCKLSSLRAAPPESFPAGLSADDQAAIRRDMGLLADRIAALRRSRSRRVRDRVADVDLFHKGAVWALRYEPSLTPADTALVRKALARGLERAEDLSAGRLSWTEKKGAMVRGYA